MKIMMSHQKYNKKKHGGGGGGARQYEELEGQQGVLLFTIYPESHWKALSLQYI